MGVGEGGGGAGCDALQRLKTVAAVWGVGVGGETPSFDFDSRLSADDKWENPGVTDPPLQLHIPSNVTVYALHIPLVCTEAGKDVLVVALSI